MPVLEVVQQLFINKINMLEAICNVNSTIRICLAPSKHVAPFVFTTYVGLKKVAPERSLHRSHISLRNLNQSWGASPQYRSVHGVKGHTVFKHAFEFSGVSEFVRHSFAGFFESSSARGLELRIQA